jgi:hypothetical protein
MYSLLRRLLHELAPPACGISGFVDTVKVISGDLRSFIIIKRSDFLTFVNLFYLYFIYYNYLFKSV